MTVTPSFISQFGLLLLWSCLTMQTTSALSDCEYYERVGIRRISSLRPMTRRSKSSIAAVTTTAYPGTEFSKNSSLSLSNNRFKCYFIKRYDERLFLEFSLCRGYFFACMSSDLCESGTVCVEGTTSSQCCTSPYSQCPNVDKLGIKCNKRVPVNWCNSDRDCRSSEDLVQLCCPTGCNYNICLNLNSTLNTLRSNVFKFAVNGLTAVECPSVSLLRMKCSARRATHWCMSDEDCNFSETSTRR
uniref:WAP domain-containing protein n=1 Tax=Syphacia muris TaxID=451379 RepID=A0A0N5AG13_9BILA